MTVPLGFHPHIDAPAVATTGGHPLMHDNQDEAAFERVPAEAVSEL